MTDPYLRSVERANGCDDPDCPNCGETVRLGHSCEGCGWYAGMEYDDLDNDRDWEGEA